MNRSLFIVFIALFSANTTSLQASVPEDGKPLKKRSRARMQGNEQKIDITRLPDGMLQGFMFDAIRETMRREEQKAHKEESPAKKSKCFEKVGRLHSVNASLLSSMHGETEETAIPIALQQYLESDALHKAAQACGDEADLAERKEDMLHEAMVPVGAARLLCGQFDLKTVAMGFRAQEALLMDELPEDAATLYGFVSAMIDAEEQYLDEEEEGPLYPGHPDYVGPSDCGYSSDWIFKDPADRDDY